MIKEFIILEKSGDNYTVKFGKKVYQRILISKRKHKWIRFKTKHDVKIDESKNLNDLLSKFLLKNPILKNSAKKSKIQKKSKVEFDKRMVSATTKFHTSRFIPYNGLQNNYKPSQIVLECLKEGSLLEAAKWVKHETGLGLKESKDIADTIKQNIKNFV